MGPKREKKITLCKHKVNASPSHMAEAQKLAFVCPSAPLSYPHPADYFRFYQVMSPKSRKITLCKKKFNAHTLICSPSHIHTHALIHMLSIFVFLYQKGKTLHCVISTDNKAIFMVFLTDTLLSASFFYW